MSNTKKNKKKQPKKTHISPPAAKTVRAASTTKPKKAVVAAGQRKNPFVSRRVLYAVAIIVLVLSTGVSLFNSNGNQTTAGANTTPSVTSGTTANPTPTSEAVSQKVYTEPPKMTIDQNKKYVATLTTEKGDIKLELFPKDAPKTVNNFMFLANDGFYDGTTFHRVLRTPSPFMAQGGDPTGTGTGGPGYKFEDEISSRKHLTGTLSMANSGPNTNGSQFFIMYAPQPQLDGKHTVFGQVTEGMDVLQKITERDPDLRPPFKGDVIKSIRVQEVG